MSPENRMRSGFFCSCSISTSIEAEPRRWPAFQKRALMPGAGGHSVEPLAVSGDQPHVLQLGVLDQIARTRILAGRVDHDFLDRFRVVAKLGGHGMKTVDQAGGHDGVPKETKRDCTGNRRRAAVPGLAFSKSETVFLRFAAVDRKKAKKLLKKNAHLKFGSKQS